jgi:hypothetical protein
MTAPEERDVTRKSGRDTGFSLNKTKLNYTAPEERDVTRKSAMDTGFCKRHHFQRLSHPKNLN